MAITLNSSALPVRAQALAVPTVCAALTLVLALAACGPNVAPLPDAPQALAARPLDGAVAVSWTLGGDGGSPLTNHAYSLDDGGTWTGFEPPVIDGSGAVIGDLVNGELHRLRVRAVSARGPGAVSDAVDAVAARPGYLVAAHAPGHLQVTGIAPQRDAGTFVVGYHDGDASFGAIPPGESTVSEIGFLAMLDADAAWAWKVDLEAGGTSSIGAIAPHGDGAVVAGTFTHALALDPVASFSSAGEASFVAAVAGDGGWLWAALVDAQASSGVEVVAVAVAPDGDVVVAGTLYGTVHFGELVVGPASTYDAFVARLTPDGAWRWVALAGADAVTVPKALTLAPDGTAVIAGRTRSARPVASLPATGNAGNDDGFVAALDSDGATWRWVRTLGGSGNDRVEDVVVADGSILAVGAYPGTATFGPLGPRPPPFPSQQTAYLLRLTLDGSWLRVTTVGSTQGAEFDRVVVHPGGGTVVAGRASGDVESPIGESVGTSPGPYVAVFDAFEALTETRTLVIGDGASITSGWGAVHALAIGVGDVPIVAGSLTGTLSFDGDVITQMPPAFGPDLFVWKASPALF